MDTGRFVVDMSYIEFYIYIVSLKSKWPRSLFHVLSKAQK